RHDALPSSAAGPDRAASRGASPRREDGMSARVLIVDDSPTQLEALRSVLVDAHLQVLTATSGEEAYEMACRERPELVLSDVIMPGMSGFDLCRAIKQTMGEAAPAVVLLTSLADPR